MRAGSVIRLRRVKTYGKDGRSFFEYDPPKDEVFVCVVLGFEKRALADGEEIDVDEALKALGWVRAGKLDGGTA